MHPVTSNRGLQWVRFAGSVLKHIEEYTVLQYGDAPKDNVEIMTPDEVMAQIKRYVSRAGRNARGQEEAERDMLKLAHYACIYYDKIRVVPQE